MAFVRFWFKGGLLEARVALLLACQHGILFNSFVSGGPAATCELPTHPIM
jgi:hypothetical protein